MGTTTAPLPLSQSLTIISTGTKNAEGRPAFAGAGRFKHTDSAFVAHLLAVKHGVPAFNRRRISSPQAAQIAYMARDKQLVHVQNLVSIAA